MVMDPNQKNTPIAVIGMGCWYPGADSPLKLWTNILGRRRQFRRIPKCRLPLEDYHHKDKSAVDKTYAQMAAVIDGFTFDWSTRRIPRLTYLATDIVQWLALETALQAVADAGYASDTIPGRRTGVIVGNSLTGEQSRSQTMRLRWPYVRKAFLKTARQLNTPQAKIHQLEHLLEDNYKSAFPAVNEDTLAGGLSNTIAGRICNYLNLNGGGYTVDGACSSSLLAIATAATSLSTGDLDLALAGGVDNSLDPFEMVGFSKTGALTAGEMNVYDRRASGFIPGEGCGFVVLKRYEDALRDNNEIYAVVRGWGVSSDGSNAAITAPSVSGQSLALQRAYEDTAYGIKELDFIEGHGTGTVVGDRVELEAIALLTENASDKNGDANRICGITSLKSIIGHTKAASGIGGFIKAVMAVNRRVSPPMAGFRYPSQTFNESARHLFPIQIGKCLAPTATMRAGVSAMGFGGINSHLTVESSSKPSAKLEPQMDERALMASAQENEIFVLSAQARSPLVAKCQRLIDAADGISYAELTDLAADLGNEVNPDDTERAALIAGTPDELVTKLLKLKIMMETEPLDPGEIYSDKSERIWLGNTDCTPRIGFLFPGQGSQQLNMARILVERFQFARDLVRSADLLSAEFDAEPLSQVMFRPTDQAGDAGQLMEWFGELSKTANAQPAICLAAILWCRFLKELGIIPVAAGGHSLGEATAFYAAGAFDEVSLLRFAYRRGQTMSTGKENDGAMISLRCGHRQVDRLLERVTDGYAALANINAPNQMVVAGETHAIEQLIRLAEAESIHVRRLPVSNAFHCDLTTPAAVKLAENTTLPTNLPASPVRLLSCIDGKALSAGIDMPTHFVRQVTARVNFVALAEAMAECSDILIEVGPGRVLSGLVNATVQNGNLSCLPTESSPFRTSDLNVMLAHLFVNGQAINWNALYAGRLVNPFMPAADRVFFINPCETQSDIEPAEPPALPMPDNVPTEPLIADLSGVSTEELREYLSRRGAFLSEFIKMDMKHALPDRAPVSVSPLHPTAAKKPSPLSESAAGDHTDLSGAEVLYDLVEELTGFPRKTLTPELRLLDDLNLDSIKSGDLIARFADRLDFSGTLDPVEWTNASLEEIVNLAAQRSSEQTLFTRANKPLVASEVLQVIVNHIASIGHLPISTISTDALIGPDLRIDEEALHQLLVDTSKSFKLDLNLDIQPLLNRSPAQVAEIFTRIANAGRQTDLFESIDLPRTSVREMRIDFIESERPKLPEWYGKRTEDQWPNAQVLVLGDDVQDDVCQAIEKHLHNLGAGLHAATFDTIQTQAFKDAFDRFSHFIAVLPQTTTESELTENRLQRIINRLSFAAMPPPASHGPRRRSCLVFVQFGGGYFGTRSDAAFLDQCCATALAKSVYLERDDLKIRVIDFDPNTAVDQIAEKTVLEIIGPQNFVEVGYDRQLTRRTAVANIIEPAQYKQDLISWSSNDVILVTGGAKGITAECALAVSQTVGTKMALIGRTPLQDPDDGSEIEKKIPEILQRYEQHGLQARYYSCDVCDGNAVALTVARIEKDMGRITGIIHGAGQNTPRRFYQVSTEDAIEEVSPKVIGVLNLLSAMRENPPKLIVGLTSVIGITGMQGNGWYAFSNEALDLILRRFASNHPETRTLSVAYSIWRDEGMGARMGSVEALKKQGIGAIPTHEGVMRFVRLFLSNPGTHQVLVTARITHLDTLGAQTPPPISGARFLEKRVHFTPGVESAFLVHLSLEKDLYLQDHRYNDAFLFPAVFGLEAMAQAVAYVTGVTGFRGVQVENLKLRRPIIVDAEKGADIIIWAQTIERAEAGDKLAVKSGIFKVSSDSKSEYFSATFVIGSMNAPEAQPLDLPGEPLDLDPSKDLYRDTLLFQGDRFQHIDRVHLLDHDGNESGTVVVGTSPTEPEYAKRAFADPEHQGFLLGNPFLRDNLLQSAALLIPQDTSLPMAVQRWDIYPWNSEFTEQRRMVIRTRLQGIEDQQVETSVDAMDQNGTPAERLTGYRLKILKHHDDYPTVADLLLPDNRDTLMLQHRLSNLATQLRSETPQLNISFMPGLHDLPKAQRQALELPLLRKSAQRWIERSDKSQPEVKIRWQPTGKPEAQVAGATLDVSLAHDNRYCLVAVGSSLLGCDLAPVTHRTLSQWSGQLGPFARNLISGKLSEEELNRRGTSLWAVKEVLQKLSTRETISIKYEKSDDDSILFTCLTDKGLIKILTFWMTLTRGRERVLALSMNDAPAASAVDEEPGIDYPGYETLLNKQHYKIIEGGPQGQVVFIHRFPVTFMPSGQLSRNIYYSHFFFWAGKVREASAWPVLNKIANQFATGQWGGVTNFADLKILGEATTNDLIEVRLWASGNGGPHNSVLDLTYDFRKILTNGGYERLAWLEQQTTWVRILDHGVVKVEPYPDYYGEFVNNMMPRNDAPNLPEALPEPLKVLLEDKDEALLYLAPTGPAVAPVLFSQQMETCLEDANIVGNIYFANYYSWQGRVRDRYLFNLIPEYFQGTGGQGELLCLNCRVDHLREAMPFDRIEVRMALKSLKTCRAALHFEYFKLDRNGQQTKLATGKQDVVWVRRDAQKKPIAAPFPAAVHQAFEKAINHI